MSETKTKTELPACPVETTLTLIGDKWKVLILRDLLPGTKRFGELKKSIGSVSQKVLTAQLRDMEESGLVHRKVYAEVPLRVEYSLTELGQSLKPILDSMWAWGEGYQPHLILAEMQVGKTVIEKPGKQLRIGDRYPTCAFFASFSLSTFRLVPL